MYVLKKSTKFREKISTEFLSGQNSRICTCWKNRQNFGKNLNGISLGSKFSYMYVLKKSTKFRKKISTEFPSGQNSRICACWKNQQNFGKKSQLNFSQIKILVYVCWKNRQNFGKKSQLNFSQIKILVYVLAEKIDKIWGDLNGISLRSKFSYMYVRKLYRYFYQGVICLWIQVRAQPRSSAGGRSYTKIIA